MEEMKWVRPRLLFCSFWWVRSFITPFLHLHFWMLFVTWMLVFSWFSFLSFSKCVFLIYKVWKSFISLNKIKNIRYNLSPNEIQLIMNLQKFHLGPHPFQRNTYLTYIK
jgi:hypothetical protein